MNKDYCKLFSYQIIEAILAMQVTVLQRIKQWAKDFFFFGRNSQAQHVYPL